MSVRHVASRSGCRFVSASASGTTAASLAELQPRREHLLRHHLAQLVAARRVGPCEVELAAVRERVAAPGPQCRRGRLEGRGVVAQTRERRGRRGRALDLQQIDVLVGDGEEVARMAGDDRIGPDDEAEPADLPLQRVRRVVGQLLAPHGVEQRVRRDDAAGVDREPRQQDALPRCRLRQ